MHKQIPIACPGAAFEPQAKEIHSAINRVLASGRYVLGEEVHQFESAFADFNSIKYCVGTASGTDALILALKAVGVGPGDEVITVSHTAVATVAAIELAGGEPVFADIDPTTRCMSPPQLAHLISPKTKVILPVHLYGQPAPMGEIVAIARQNDIQIVEDCAQAHGAEIKGQKVGTFGDAAAFSFYPTKNLGAMGDGGAVVTHSYKIAGRIRQLREYGWDERRISDMPGMNSRLDEVQAAILSVKLPLLSENNKRRRSIANEYRTAIGKKGVIAAPTTIEGTLHAMHLFVIESDQRDDLAAFLKTRGVGTKVHYPCPVHLQPAYKDKYRGSDNLHVTERLCKRILSLPLYPELTDFQVERICMAIREFDVM